LYWVLDPIDGTQGFLRGGNALYVVGLALIQDGKPVLAVMGCPNHALHDQRGLIMAASLGGGCWVKPLTGTGAFIKSEVARRETIPDARFCISDREIWSDTLLAKALNDMHELPHVQTICCGSLCKYLAIALGEVSAFLLPAAPSNALKVWDHAAGILCVSEAGGRVSDLDGTAIDSLVGNGKQVFTVEGGGILATNNALHDHLLTAIRKHTVSD
jgi:3'(2'), 5'-bisphosphate nucleotidase